MVNGGFRSTTLSILDELNIDEDELEWEMLATCRDIDPSLADIFFDLYESDKVMAEQADNMCMSCPVAKQCLMEGLKSKRYGCWGGVFLDYSGKPSKKYNAHKSKETWKELATIHGYKMK
jgi:hypothetical protein